jgi:hypothetical protein
MYCKLFASLYQGTPRGRSDEILVFTNLLAHADKDGYVDKHFLAIAQETGLQLDRVKLAIESLNRQTLKAVHRNWKVLELNDLTSTEFGDGELLIT